MDSRVDVRFIFVPLFQGLGIRPVRFVAVFDSLDSIGIGRWQMQVHERHRSASASDVREYSAARVIPNRSDE
jgi:hypothetical protein